MTATSDCFVSVIAPLHNDGQILEPFLTEVLKVLSDNYSNYEVVLVDDASTDSTAFLAERLLRRQPCTRYLRLSKPFGQEIAIASGLDAVIGDFVVVMNPDTDPPAIIPQLVGECRQGTGVVFGVFKNPPPEPWALSVLASLFHITSRFLFGVRLPRHFSHCQALSRQAVNAVTQMKDKYRYLLLQSSSIGDESRHITYDPILRSGKRKKRSLWDSLNRTFTLFLTHSKHPLRFVSWLGLFASILNALYVIYIIAIYFLKDQVAEGWTTLSLQTAGMFFFVFLILTVLTEYVGRILDEARAQPLYFIQEEKTSAVLVADETRRNVVTQSPDK